MMQLMGSKCPSFVKSNSIFEEIRYYVQHYVRVYDMLAISAKSYQFE